MVRYLHLICLSLWLAWPAPVQARDVVVFAAASLKNVLDDLAQDFEDATGTGIAVSYAGSSALARQIQQGAPADLFISANPDWMDLLAHEALIDPASRTLFARNRLVLIGTDPARIDPGRLADALGPDTRLAMALVEAVPAGIYGKAALTHLGQWDAAAPFVVQTDNVRAALRLVALGEARFGIVYATDAAVVDRVHILARFAPDSHPPIRYPMARMADSTHPRAQDLHAFLTGPQARARLVAAGFLTEPPQ